MDRSKKRDRWASSSSDDDDDDAKKQQSSRITHRKVTQQQPLLPKPPNHHQLYQSSSVVQHDTDATAASIIKGKGNLNDDHVSTTMTNKNENHHPDDIPSSSSASTLLNNKCRSVYDTYEKIERISEGSYGIVWKAKCIQPIPSLLSSADSKNSMFVALKQMKFPSDNNLFERTSSTSMILPGGDPTPGVSSSTNTHNDTIQNDDGVWKLGVPSIVLREINALFHLREHLNIVTLHEIVLGGGGRSSGDDDDDDESGARIPKQIYMVMDYYSCDLKTAIQQYTTQIVCGPLLQSELMGIVQQIVDGVNYIHDHNYMHRDLKPSNILVKPIYNSTTGQYITSRVAIADFGLARPYHSNNNNNNHGVQAEQPHMTLPVVTLWYRAPELLFGETQYTPAIDMWSIGCIMGELIRSSGYSNTTTSTAASNNCFDVETEDEEYNASCALLKGRGELDQIDAIFQLLGVPNDTSWPSFTSLPNAKLLRWKAIPSHELSFAKLFPSIVTSNGHQQQGGSTISLSNQTYLDHNGHDLLRQLLQLDPNQRITARQTIQHPYLTATDNDKKGGGGGTVTPTIPNFSFL